MWGGRSDGKTKTHRAGCIRKAKDGKEPRISLHPKDSEFLKQKGEGCCAREGRRQAKMCARCREGN